MDDFYAVVSGGSLYAGWPAPSPPVSSLRYYTDGPFLFDAPPLGVVADPASPLRYITPARSSVASPKSDYQWGTFGPTSTRVVGSWLWENSGGDFINSAGTPQATTSPHFSWSANAVTSGSHTYSVDVTTAMQTVRAGNRYNAWFLRATASTWRGLATNFHASPPYIDVVYSDASTARLACRIGAYIDASSAFGRAGAPTAGVGYGDKAAFEFERPTKTVSSATLVIVVESHTAIASTISAFLANPTLNTNPVLVGIADGYVLDEGIEAHPSVIMVHRPVDTSVVGDHFRANLPDYERRASWSPHLFDHTQSPDITKLPYVGDGKFAGGGNVSVVPSTYTGDGYQKLADGLAAFRVLIPGVAAADGSATGYSGAHGVTAMAFLPEEHCGLLGEVYVRFYLYLAPAATDALADMRMYRTEAVQPAEYAIHGGKFGLGASQWTPFGGNSGTGGGPRGWTNRFAWQEVPGDVNATNAIRAGIHSWDMLGYDMMFGQQGGLGLEFHPANWYCVETRLKLNTVDLLSETPQTANPSLNESDAEIEAWIDGRRVMLRVGFSYRALPLPAVDTGDVRTPPIRRLGVREITFNDFQGGLLPSLTDRIKFYSALVVSTEYIGPMRMNA